MIKGVNKTVIEISDTGNECFERAILFIRPESAERDNDHIRRGAVNYLAGIRLRPWCYPRGKMLFGLLRLLGAAAAGAAVSALLLTF